MKLKEGLIIASITGGSLFPIKGYSQIIQTTKKQELVEIFQTNEEIDHERIIHTDIDSLINKYGEKEALNLINYHVLIEFNRYRTKAKAPTLTATPEALKTVAQNRAINLAKQDTSYHGKGKDFLGEKLEEAKIPYFISGEILAKGQKDIDTVIQEWLRSQRHKENILRPQFRKMGLGYQKGVRVVNRTD